MYFKSVVLTLLCDSSKVFRFFVPVDFLLLIVKSIRVGAEIPVLLPHQQTSNLWSKGAAYSDISSSLYLHFLSCLGRARRLIISVVSSINKKACLLACLLENSTKFTQPLILETYSKPLK